MEESRRKSVIIVGAGPGGVAVAASLKAKGISDVLLIDKGDVGQSWLEYPPETRLLSESSGQKDENMIAGIPLSEVTANIPHPTHEMYQRYLQYVVSKLDLPVQTNTEITSVTFDQTQKIFTLHTEKGDFTSPHLVWATGMYETPNEHMNCTGCFVHYSRIQQWDHIIDDNIIVVGGANGATEVVIQLAKPGRHIKLLCSSEFECPEPCDCLWKENRMLVKQFELEGLVDIIENFRVKQINHNDLDFVIEGSEGQTIESQTRPILCIGFLPNIAPISHLVDIKPEGHQDMLNITEAHESKKTPGLYVAGTIGKIDPKEGFIRHFRDFGDVIATDIKSKS